MKTMRYSSVLVVALLCLNCLAADESFYQRYLRLVDTSGPKLKGHTSPLLADTNNITAKVTNTVIRLDNLLTNGEVAGIRLGMTTDEVVARWGKPRGLQCSLASGPSFTYADTQLKFRENALDYVYIPEAVLFDHDLRGDSRLKDWVRVLGEPTMRKDDGSGSTLAYETRGVMRTVLLLTFLPDGEVKFRPMLWRDPNLTNWFKLVEP